MHPVVALALVVIVIGFLARGEWSTIAVVACACAAIGGWHRPLSLRHMGRTIWRLRFFYASLLVLFAWLTPGEPVWPVLGGWSPVQEGLSEGLRHIVILALIVTTVQLFMASVSRTALIGALRWWLQPLRRVGVDADRIALRLLLVAQALPRLRVLAQNSGGGLAGRSPWKRLSDRVGNLMAQTLDEAEQADLPTVQLPTEAGPPASHWLVLIGVAAVLALL